MHTVPRSPEPGFLASIAAVRSQWSELSFEERRNIRDALREDFSGCCAYCEKHCSGRPGVSEHGETIDHFRPRSKFPDEWLRWPNLMYACVRCNDSKGNSWPEVTDNSNRRLSIIARYKPVSSYVSPNVHLGQPSAENYFAYRLTDGIIVAAETLSPDEWSLAYRTIDDLDLNSDRQAAGDSLPYLRRERLDFVIDAIGDPTMDIDRSMSILGAYSQPDQPFSSYIAAYVESLGIR